MRFLYIRHDLFRFGVAGMLTRTISLLAFLGPSGPRCTKHLILNMGSDEDRSGFPGGNVLWLGLRTLGPAVRDGHRNERQGQFKDGDRSVVTRTVMHHSFSFDNGLFGVRVFFRRPSPRRILVSHDVTVLLALQ